MTGSFGFPYRAPCGGWPGRQGWFLGGPFQHRIEAAAAVPLFANTTMVADWQVPAGAAVRPYRRLDDQSTWPDTGTCPGPGTQPNPSCASTTPGAQPCGPWLAPPYDGRPADGPGAIDRNSYASTPTGTRDFSACRKLGFKNVQARKYWHGRFGYLSHDPSGRQDAKALAGETCGCAVESEQPAPDGTKYLSEDVTCMTHVKYWYETDVSGVWGFISDEASSAEASAAVGRYTGVVTQGACSTAGDSPPASLLSDHIGITAAAAMGWYSNQLTTWVNSGYSVTERVSGSIYSATATDGVTTRGTASLDAGSGAYSAVNYDDGGGQISDESASFTNTCFSHTLNSYDPELPSDPHSEYYLTTFTVTGTLGGPYTSGDLASDVLGLLALWNLADDVVYPWRTDEWVSIGPLASYDEAPSAVSPSGGLSLTAWTDSNAARYTGAVRGAPLSAGRGPHFDWLHETWRVCTGDGGLKSMYRYAYGAWSTGRDPDGDSSSTGDATDSLVPMSATQWTQNWGSAPAPGFMPSGAWMVFGPQIGVDQEGDPIFDRGCLVVQKWAEIKVPRPSVNFARPCGADRLALEPAGARCATYQGTVAGKVRVTLDSATTLVTGDECLVAGVAGAGTGVYKVTKISALVYELTTLIVLVSSVPFPVGAGILGKLRWPAAPGLCGRIAIAAATQSGANVGLTLAAAAPYLYSGDQVDFAGVPGLGAGLAVTVIDETHLSVPGALSEDYAGGGYLSSHGAAAYPWDDDQPKGDYFKVDWSFNFRDFAERDRVNAQAANCAGCPGIAVADATVIRPNQSGQGMPREVSCIQVTPSCQAFQVCCPQVLCISPSSETWVNGVTYDFPAFTADARYGARWQSAIVQTMSDPLWEPPHRLCVASPDGSGSTPTACPWSEDTGVCAEDNCDEPTGQGARYYAQRPWVEGIQGVPAGAPAMPSGCEINVLMIADLNGATAPAGVILPPPTGLGYVDADNGADPLQPTPAITPWGVCLRELGCVCHGGAFSADYEANGAKC